MQDQPEVVVNLWYITDRSGLLISLKGRAYVTIGTDEEKLAFLNERAQLDYLIAQDFSIPDWVATIIAGKYYNTALYSQIENSGREAALFEECMKELQAQFSKLHALKISNKPLLSITPLWMDNDNKVRLVDQMQTVNF